MPTIIDRRIDFSTFKYRIEPHAHTSPSSSCSMIGPRELVDLYSQLGYDGIAITNHIKADDAENGRVFIENYTRDYYEALDEGEKVGLKVYFGAEILIKGAEFISDHLFYGITPKDLEELVPMIENGLEHLRENYKNQNLLIIQAHPFRGKTPHVNPIPLIDGIETMNTLSTHNSRPILASKAASENPEYITISGSDCHFRESAGCASILTETLPKDSLELAEVLKTKRVLHEYSGAITIPPSFRYD